jgi:Fur family transcriptional regulator, ferric uptake regulator
MIKELENRLYAKQIRPTAMRLLVLEILQKQISAMSLNDLEAAFDRADRITLYRTLKTFEEKGVVHQITDGNGAVKYALCEDSCVPEHHHDLHVHFYCNSCKETYCLPKSRVPAVQLPEDFQAEEVNLLVKGVCKRCAK